jgi:hypothetical protein
MMRSIAQKVEMSSLFLENEFKLDIHFDDRIQAQDVRDEMFVGDIISGKGTGCCLRIENHELFVLLSRVAPYTHKESRIHQIIHNNRGQYGTNFLDGDTEEESSSSGEDDDNIINHERNFCANCLSHKSKDVDPKTWFVCYGVPTTVLFRYCDSECQKLHWQKSGHHEYM